MQGHERSEGRSKPEMGLQSLGQGSQIRAWNGEGWAGSRCGVPKTETKVCGGTGYMVGDFRTSLGCGDTWIRVLVRCYTECNKDLGGGNLVDIRTGSTVHWRLTFITMGDYAGLQVQ